MNKSGLPGFASAALFSGIAFLFVTPIAIGSGQLQQINFSGPLMFAVLAAIVGALGLLVFNTGLSEVKTGQISGMFTTMIMVQLSVPAVYQMFLSGDLSLKRIAGIGGAFAVTYLLTS
ncbi:hypothetical protein H6777_03235 [Candidatus Nomurabacteria bacterium]|nr:hypothetical protein [Candidatus Nomurabacteria bacterium]